MPVPLFSFSGLALAFLSHKIKFGKKGGKEWRMERAGAFLLSLLISRSLREEKEAKK